MFACTCACVPLVCLVPGGQKVSLSLGLWQGKHPELKGKEKRPKKENRNPTQVPRTLGKTPELQEGERKEKKYSEATTTENFPQINVTHQL